MTAASLSLVLVSCQKDKPANTHDSVDLGITTKDGKTLRWATCNIGATLPTDCGSYFAWGETETKDHYDWSHEGDYLWGVLKESSKTCGMTKYTGTEVKDEDGNPLGDGLVRLEPGNDPATKIWGPKWRTPTLDEIEALFNSTIMKSSWDDQKKGFTFTSLKTGESIFLPAGGCCINYSIQNKGEIGEYWASSVVETKPMYAHGFFFESDDSGPFWGSRYMGRPVRAVMEE